MASTSFTPPHVYEQPFPAFDINAIDTPAYVVDVALLRKNMEKLAHVQSESGARVLLALKGFSMFSVFPIMREYLSGCCASGLNEALLAQEFGKEVHVYAPAFKAPEMQQIIPISHHLSFNSLAQFRKFKPMLDAAKAATGHAPSPGIRVNPEHSEVEVSLYDPCSPGCRLGIRSDLLEGEDLTGIEGLHFHALCEQDSDVLERTVAAVEKRFPRLLEQVQWVNMGGGHHITRKDYDVDLLIRVLRTFREKWGKEVYIEPGEAAGLNTGYLIAEVQDIIAAPTPTAILDISATAHMPDTLEMPYRPHIFGAGLPGEHPYEYKMGGMSCLAGDVLQGFSFPEPLRIGQRLVFADMAHYTMVKTTTFNGVPHPDIAIYDPSTQDYRVVRRFDYPDFRNKLS